MLKKLLFVVAFAMYASALVYAQGKKSYAKVVDVADVTIVRDSFGVPHIFGKTDANAAYGLAWAHAEDDFKHMQELHSMGKGTMGSWKGKKGAIIDYANQLLRLEQLMDEKYETDISDEFKLYLQAYCQGINDYAAAHPEEVLVKRNFPMQPKDILKGYCVGQAVMSGVHIALKNIMDGTIENEIDVNFASNAFAFSRRITADSTTYLVINAHQPLEGPMSFYEAHMHSEQGLNIHGGLFPGSVSILHGANEHLGWAHTMNGYDKVDVYKLKMHPKKKLFYEFDGEWVKLEQSRAKLKVKVKGIVLPVRKKIYWSKYGATMITDQGAYSIRLASNMVIGAAEQWFRMGKSKNFAEFKQALEMQQIPLQNIIYADKDDNVFFMCGGMIPKRDENYTWNKVLPGNTSKTLWTEFYGLDGHPQVLNPECGYIFNVNNSPFNSTCAEENPNPADYPVKTTSFIMEDNNRSIRITELWDSDGKISYEDFKRIKYDLVMPEEGVFMDMVYRMQRLDQKKYSSIAPTVQKLSNWNRSMAPDNEEATIFYLSISHIFTKLGIYTTGFRQDLNLTDEFLADAVGYAQKHLTSYFGSINVKMGELMRLSRGDKSFPIGGFPDVMASMMGTFQPDGTVRADRGEGLIMLVRFDANGPVSMSSVNAFGASSKPDSPHYNDQMELFLRNELKPMSYDKETIFSRAKRVYHPGR